MGQQLTASRLGLAQACLWSFSDEAPEVLDARPTVYQADGSRLAEWQAGLINGRYSVFVDPPPRVQRWWEAWQSIRPEVAHAEVAIAYDPRTGRARILGLEIGRQYEQHGALAGEICMSADVAGLDDEWAVVTDTKGGPGERWLGRVPHAGDNPQLRCNAMAWALANGRTRARVELHHVDEAGSIAQREIATFDALELGAIEAEIVELSARLAKGKINAKPGTHCVDLYCSALSVCEAAQREAAQLIPVDRLTQAIARDPGKAVIQYELASKLMDRWGAELKRYVDDHGAIVLGDGEWEYGKQFQTVKPEEKPRAGFTKTVYKRRRKKVA